MVEEAFLDDRHLRPGLELQPRSDNALELTVCDGAGTTGPLAVSVRHQDQARPLGQAVLPTQLITKPLQIEVLNRSRQRVKQVVAPSERPCRARFSAPAAPGPGRPHRRADLRGEPRRQADGDRRPRSTTCRRLARRGGTGHRRQAHHRGARRGAGPPARRTPTETATIEAPPPPRRPTRAEIDEVRTQIDELLAQFSGSIRDAYAGRASQSARTCGSAALRRRAQGDPAHGRAARTAAATGGRKGQMLDPPWPRFAQLVRHCLDLAAEVAEATGRDRAGAVRACPRPGALRRAGLRGTQPGALSRVPRKPGEVCRLPRAADARYLPGRRAAPTRPPEEEAKRTWNNFAPTWPPCGSTCGPSSAAIWKRA